MSIRLTIKKGYPNRVTKINITDNTMEFIQGGQSKKYTYKYVGKKILTYKKGNRGVRFLFEATDADAGNSSMFSLATTILLQ